MTKKRKIMIIAGVAVVAIVAYSFLKSKKSTIEYSTAAISRGELVQTVSEVGTIKASKELDLNFAQSGKVNHILAKVGEPVKKDQLLMELDYSSLIIKQQEAASSLEVARANLQKLISGATRTDLAVSQAQVSQAQATYQGAIDSLSKTKLTTQESLAQAKKKLGDLQDTSSTTITPLEQSVATAKVALENAQKTGQQNIDNSKNSLLSSIEHKLSLANNALDAIARILEDDDAKDNLSVKNPSYLVATKSAWAAARERLASASSDLASVKSVYSDSKLKAVSASALQVLNMSYSALGNCFSVLENSVTATSFSQSSLDSFKTSISSQQTTVNSGISVLQGALDAFNNAELTAQTSISSANTAYSQAQANLSDGLISAANSLNSLQVSTDQQIAAASTQVESAKQALDVAQSQLNKLNAPARREDISLATAQVSQAQASLDLVAKQISDNMIKAPIDGQVTKINYEIGEQFSASKSALSMLTENNFEIDVDVSESDISKIKVNNKAEMTFDAFGSERKFQGSVTSIDPAATVISDVIYYKVKIALEYGSEQLGVKPGMTANAVITTDHRQDVLIVPSRSIIEKDGKKIVRVLENGNVREVTVLPGLVGDEGLTEILAGDNLKPGDLAITFVKDTSKK